MEDQAKLELFKKWVQEVISKVTDSSFEGLQKYLRALQPRIDKKENAFLAEFNNVSEILQQLKQGKGKRCIHFSAAKGDLQTFKYLVETHGCDVHVEDDLKNDSFFTALQHGHLPIVQYLVEQKGVSPEKKRQNVTGFFLAAMNGDLLMAKYLHSKGADIQCQTTYGRPINAAAVHLHLPVVEWLLSVGASPDSQQVGGVPAPIIMAIDYNRADLASILLAHKASTAVTDPSGMPALHLAAQSQATIDILKLIISAGADCETHFKGKTALEYAFAQDNFEAVSILREKTKKKDLVLLKEPAAEAQPQYKQDKEQALRLKEKGNQLFQKSRFNEAIQLYKQGLTFQKGNAVLLGNISACYLKLNDGQKARQYGSECKAANPLYDKGPFREAQAYRMLGQYADAAASYWQAMKLSPENAYIKKQFKSMVEKARMAKKVDKIK